jgi:hypothetical protein
MTTLSNRDPHGGSTPTTHNSGSMRPVPSGPHTDPRSGGEIPASQHSGPGVTQPGTGKA